MMPLRPRWVYDDGTAVDFVMSLPQRPFTPFSRGLGGSDSSGAGVPAAFEIRRDQLLAMTLRFPEWEWPDVERLLRHLQRAGIGTLYLDVDGAASHTIYGESPSLEEEIRPRRSDAGTLEIDIVVRRTTDSVFTDRYFDESLLRIEGGALGVYTFTRPGSVGAYVDKDGVLKSAAADTPRVEYIDTDGDSRLDTPLLLVEGLGRTNELTQSEDLTHADWTTVGLSARNADQAKGPEDTLALDELIEDSGNSTHRVTQPAIGMTADASYAMSAWMMANSRDYGVLWLGDNGALGTNYVRAWFDLTDGTVSRSQEGGSGSLIRAYAQDWTWLVPGLYRCVVVGSVGSGVTTIGSIIAVSSDGTNLSYTGDGSSSIYAGYAQLEDDAEYASSYIATTTAPVSRDAESFEAPLAEPPLLEETFYLKWQERGAAFQAGELPGIGSLGDGNTDGALAIRRDNSSGDGRYEVALSKNGVQLGTAEPSGTVSMLDTVEFLASISYDPVAGETTLRGELSINGLTSTVDETVIADTPPQAYTNAVAKLGNAGATAIAVAIRDRGVKTLAQMRAA